MTHHEIHRQFMVAALSGRIAANTQGRFSIEMTALKIADTALELYLNRWPHLKQPIEYSRDPTFQAYESPTCACEE